MPTWSSATALMLMSSPLGSNVLIPVTLTCKEAISEEFEVNITAVCQSGTFDPNKLLNNAACVTLQDAGTPVRYFHGIVRSITAEGTARSADSGEEYVVYRVVLVPRLWFLGQTMDCRVYQNMTAGDIISAMFQDAGLTDLTGPPSGGTVREYTVQYNESDLHFAHRLMEEEGWFFFFEHTADKHTLVISNQNSAFVDIPNATLCSGSGADGVVPLGSFKNRSGTVRGQMSYRDYDYTKPGTLLYKAQPTVLTTGGASQRDYFEWPAKTYDNDILSDRAKREMEAAEAVASLFDGSSRFGPLVPGGTFTVSSQPASPNDGSYVVRSVHHQAVDDSWISGSGASSYLNQFVAFPSATTWREPMETRRPRMDGVYTGLVMGPQSSKGAAINVQDGEEIYTDDLARVKVRFFWDWRGEATGDLSVWARVIQPWAGKGWGAQFIPRVGTEVAVAFVDGNPDRPIVIGGLYNGTQAPIYLSADKNKSGLRTRSTLSGSTTNFSELTFDDTKDSELIFMHAEKDMFTEIEQNQTLSVGVAGKSDGNRIVTVMQNETVDIKQNQTITVENNQTITVTQNRDVTVSQGDSTYTVSQGKHTETIKGDAARTVQQGNNSLTVSQGNNSVTVSTGNDSLTVSTGNYSINVNAGQMSVSAMQGIKLTCGPCSIELSPSGITISGPQISLSADGQGSFDGGGMLQLKGGMVSINS